MTLNQIRENYRDLSHPTAFSGINKISKYYKISQKKAREALSGVHSYTLHRDYKKPTVRNPFFSYRLRDHWQIDLIDLRNLAVHNDGYNYILMCVDVFSRKCFARLLKTKHASVVVKAMKDIFSKLSVLPRKILADHGSELKNRQMVTFLQEHSVELIHPASEIKAGIVERLNRTIENIIFEYMTEYETQRYIDVFDQIIKSYNNSSHSTLNGFSPNEAELDANKKEILMALGTHYSKSILSKASKNPLNVGDWVRVNLIRNKFARGYNQRWSREIFEVISISKRLPIQMYKIKSLTSEIPDEIIDGHFYRNELNLVYSGNEAVFKLERIVKKRGKGRNQECLVKWLEWPNRYNSWIKCNDAEKIANS